MTLLLNLWDVQRYLEQENPSPYLEFFKTLGAGLTTVRKRVT
jgi:hypothetical protein